MRTHVSLFALFSAFMAFSAPASAQGTPAPQEGLNVGMLRCTVDPTVGMIVGSTSRMRCQFQPADRSAPGSFRGRITKVGLSLGITSRTEVRWLVFAIGKIAPRAIAGNYAGVSASASAGAGLGANVLVGGRNNSVSLQPVSVQAQTGLNIAIGISGLNLRYLGR